MHYFLIRNLWPVDAFFADFYPMSDLIEHILLIGRDPDGVPTFSPAFLLLTHPQYPLVHSMEELQRSSKIMS
jgi:hypothetical protein